MYNIMTPPSMSTSTDTERTELHKTIWRIANDLRGSVDGWDFKSYVLGMLFYRFISENLTAYINAHERRSGSAGFNYADFSDDLAERGRKEMVKEKGFYILPSELFVNVRARARSDDNLNETLHRIFTNIETSATGTESERDMKGLFDDIDVNSAKLGSTVAKRNAKLVKLLDAIGDLPLNDAGDFSQNSIDLFGDAYEYLMTMYASEAGKSGGEFFTPQEVSELLARMTVVGKTAVRKVYDPACGSGSLLLKFAKVLGKEHVHMGFYGQEINLTTYNLCRINMFLHNINFEEFDIAHGDTLTDPEHLDDGPFEAIVSNPPYSIKWEGKNNPLLINDPRYSPAGVLAPPSKADLAFTMHILSCLSADGVAAIVEFPGVLYRGGAEQKIRQYLIDHNFVDAVIQLPPDLFFGTSIATCIIVLKKSKEDEGILFIDASDEFVRRGNKNKLTEKNQQKILDAYTHRKSLDYFAQFVHRLDVADQDHNLAVSSYVIAEDTREKIDIQVLNAQIALIVMRQQALREKIQAIIADLHRRSGLNKIEALIEKLCPEGVEFKALGEIATYTRGVSYKKSDEQVDGSIRVLRSNNITLESNQLNFDNVKTLNSSVRVRSDQWLRNSDILISAASGSKAHVGKVAYVEHERDYSFGAFMAVVRIEKNKQNFLNPKFLYYLLSSTSFEDYLAFSLKSTTINNLNAGIMKKFRIPVPPLEVQSAIVEILDTFTALLKELEAELEARKKQYEYYREEQLSFEENEVEWKTLGEICEYEQPTKYLIQRTDYDDRSKTPVLTAGKTFILGYTNETKGIYPASSVNPVIIFDDFTTSFKWVNFPFKAKSSAMKMITLKMQAPMIFRYVYYAMTVITYQPGGHARQWIKNYSQIKIPIPPIEKQKEIVTILDQFDALVNDLSIGIPAEINARRLQLEYYQNHLLTFKEASPQ